RLVELLPVPVAQHHVRNDERVELVCGDGESAASPTGWAPILPVLTLIQRGVERTTAPAALSDTGKQVRSRRLWPLPGRIVQQLGQPFVRFPFEDRFPLSGTHNLPLMNAQTCDMWRRDHAPEC